MNDAARGFVEALVEGLAVLSAAPPGLEPAERVALVYTIAGLCRDVKAATADPGDLAELLSYRLAAASEQFLTLAVVRGDDDGEIAQAWRDAYDEWLANGTTGV